MNNLEKAFTIFSNYFNKGSGAAAPLSGLTLAPLSWLLKRKEFR
jgi:hypothetical protein